MNGIIYPAIKVYINYRTPLISLEISGTSSIKSDNIIYSSATSLLNIAHSGTGTAILELEHRSSLNVAMSGTGRMILSGRVHGNGRLSVSGTSDLNAISCPMKLVTVEMSGNAFVRANGLDGVYITMSGAGYFCYRGPLLNSVISGTGSIQVCDHQESSFEPPHSSSRSDIHIGKYRQILHAFVAIIFSFFLMLQ